MSDYIASVDAGNGGTNAFLARENSKNKRFYQPSVRAKATGDSLGFGQMELEYSYVDWYENRYVTGDDVIRITRRALERHMGANRYGDEMHQFLVANALAHLGVKSGTVDLVLFAPPGLYSETKARIEDGFLADGGQVEIQLKGDKKPRHWTYETVTVLPEGLGAAICFVTDDTGQPVNTDILDGQVIIMDVGAYTLDAALLQNGDFNPESLESATWENAGVHTHIREPLLRTLHKHNNDFKILTVDDIDDMLRHGFNDGDFTISSAGKEVDLTSIVGKLSEGYADWIANNIADSVFNGFQGIKSVILVGGGAVMVQSKLEQLYGVYGKGGKVLNLKKHASTKKLHPVDMNAVGGLRFALMNNQKMKV